MKIPACVLTIFLMAFTVQARMAAPVELMILRAGDGVSPFRGSGMLSLVEVRTDGTPEGTQTGPAHEAPHTGEQSIVGGVRASLEGQLNVSSDSRYLVFGGYGTEVGGQTGTSSPSSVPRVVARFDLQSKTFDTSTRITDAFDGQDGDSGAIRGVATLDGSAYWMVGKGLLRGGSYGIRYAPHGASHSVNILPYDYNLRAIKIADGRMYFSRSVEDGSSGIRELRGKEELAKLIHEKSAAGTSHLQGEVFLEQGGYTGFQFTNDGKTLFAACDKSGLQVFSQQDGDWSRLRDTAHTIADACQQVEVVEDEKGIHVFFLRSGEEDNALYFSTWSEQGFSAPVELLRAGRRFTFRGLAALP